MLIDDGDDDGVDTIINFRQISDGTEEHKRTNAHRNKGQINFPADGVLLQQMKGVKNNLLTLTYFCQLKKGIWLLPEHTEIFDFNVVVVSGWLDICRQRQQVGKV